MRLRSCSIHPSSTSVYLKQFLGDMLPELLLPQDTVNPADAEVTVTAGPIHIGWENIYMDPAAGVAALLTRHLDIPKSWSFPMI